MADTTWVLCDHTGQVATQIANASELRFIARRNQGRQAQVTLTHQEVEASRLFELLRNGTPQLRYYRDGTLRLSAYLTAIDEGLSEDGEDRLVATFKDPFGRILGDGSEAGRHIAETVTYTEIDQGTIAWNLIDALNDVTDTGIQQGTIEATTLRDRTYEAGKNVGEALVQLTEVLGGFDFEILPLDPTSNAGKLGEFTVYGRQGDDQPEVLWGYGQGTMANVRVVTRQITPPTNSVRMVTADGLVATDSDSESITRYGEWARFISAPSDVTVQETLDAQAADRLRPEWVRVLGFTPDPDLAPSPFDDFWLGDTGRFKGADGAFNEHFVPLVNAVTIIEDPDGNETHEVEVEVAL